MALYTRCSGSLRKRPHTNTSSMHTGLTCSVFCPVLQPGLMYSKGSYTCLWMSLMQPSGLLQRSCLRFEMWRLLGSFYVRTDRENSRCKTERVWGSLPGLGGLGTIWCCRTTYSEIWESTGGETTWTQTPEPRELVCLRKSVNFNLSIMTGYRGV